MLKTLSIKKVVVAPPYRDEVNERHKRLLEASGFEVANIKGIQIERNVKIAKPPPYASYGTISYGKIEVYKSHVKVRTKERGQETTQFLIGGRAILKRGHGTVVVRKDLQERL